MSEQLHKPGDIANGWVLWWDGQWRPVPPGMPPAVAAFEAATSPQDRRAATARWQSRTIGTFVALLLVALVAWGLAGLLS